MSPRSAATADSSHSTRSWSRERSPRRPSSRPVVLQECWYCGVTTECHPYLQTPEGGEPLCAVCRLGLLLVQDLAYREPLADDLVAHYTSETKRTAKRRPINAIRSISDAKPVQVDPLQSPAKLLKPRTLAAESAKPAKPRTPAAEACTT